MMSKLSKWNMEKAKMRIDASNSKPQSPKINEQLSLQKNLLDMRNSYNAQDKQIDNKMYDELSEKWKGKKGGSGGDAFVSGLKAGIQKGSFLEDKKRQKALIDFNEQMENMVQHQNIELIKQEKIHNAKSSVAPRVMAYLNSYKTMSPNDRKVFLQNSMDEYNQMAGTDYKILDATGSEPWKVYISDGDEPFMLDLMDFIKTPDEKKLEYYLNSNEVKEYENGLKEEDNLNKEKLMASENNIEKLQNKKQEMIASGKIPEGAILFDEIQGPELKQRLEDLKIERDKGVYAENGIEALNEMERIFKDNPNISRSLAKWALSKKPTPWNNFLKTIVNQKELDALLELEKHAATLNLGVIQQFKGQRPTDILKKLIAETNPGSNFTHNAFVPIKNLYQKKFEKQVIRSKEANKAFNNRYFPTYENLEQKAIERPAQETPATEQELENLYQANMALEKRREEILKKRGENANPRG